MIPSAITHLNNHDKKLARVIRKIGPLDFKPAKKRTPFAALTKAVIGQQLSGAAATSIFKKLAGLLASGVVLEHEEVLALSDDALRSVRLSWAKTATVKELAKRAAEGSLPSKSKIVKMNDEEVNEALPESKGIPFCGGRRMSCREKWSLLAAPS